MEITINGINSMIGKMERVHENIRLTYSHAREKLALFQAPCINIAPDAS